MAYWCGRTVGFLLAIVGREFDNLLGDCVGREEEITNKVGWRTGCPGHGGTRGCHNGLDHDLGRLFQAVRYGRTHTCSLSEDGLISSSRQVMPVKQAHGP